MANGEVYAYFRQELRILFSSAILFSFVAQYQHLHRLELSFEENTFILDIFQEG